MSHKGAHTDSSASRIGGALLAGPRAERITQAFTDAVRDGLPKRHAAVAAGISEHTYHDWRKRGETGEEPYASFMHRVYEAEKDRAQELLRNLRSIATGQHETAKAGDEVKAATWLLERSFPRDFGAAQKVELTGAEGGPVQTQAVQPLFTDEQLRDMTPEQLAAAISALEGQASDGA